MVADEVSPRRRHERDQPFDELGRLEHDGDRSVAPGVAQLVAQPTVGQLAHALRGQGRPQQVPARAFQPPAVPRRHGRADVQVEAMQRPPELALPQRMTLGIEGNRLSLLLAVLERRFEMAIVDKEVHVNVAGGLRLRETAADLATAIALVSSLRDTAAPPDVELLGEVGSSGEGTRPGVSPRCHLPDIPVA